MARLTGIEWMIWNGQILQGDPERRGLRGVPVVVEAGDNRAFVAAAESAFEVELWKPATRLVIEASDVRWPASFSLDDEIEFPVFNASLEPTSTIHLHYGHAARWSKTSKPHLTDWRDGDCRIPRLGLVLSHNYFMGTDDFEAQDFEQPVYVPVCVYAPDDERAERQLFRSTGSPSRHAVSYERLPANPLDRDLHGSAGLARDCGVHVHATGGSGEEQSVSWANARFGQLSTWYASGQVPLVLADVEWPVGTVPWRDRLGYFGSGHWIALHGNADTNSAWPAIVPNDAPISAHEGRVVVDGTELVGDDLAGWYCLDDKHRNVLVLFDTGEAGARLSGLLQVSLRVGDSRSAVFRVDPSSPTGWRRLEPPGPR